MVGLSDLFLLSFENLPCIDDYGLNTKYYNLIETKYWVANTYI